MTARPSDGSYRSATSLRTSFVTVRTIVRDAVDAGRAARTASPRASVAVASRFAATVRD